MQQRIVHNAAAFTANQLSQVAIMKKRAIANQKERIIHLPVAPHIAARTRFSPSLPQRVNFMMPHEALAMLNGIMEERSDEETMVAITGPGDPLAVPDTTIQTVELVRQRYPDIRIGLKTLGIGCERFAGDLARAGVNYIEIQVDAIDTEILEKIYAWIRPGLKTLKISDAVELLVREQRNAVSALKYNDIGVSIITTLYPGFNFDHLNDISNRMMELGADSISLIPYEPMPDADVTLQPPELEIIREAHRIAGLHLPVVSPLLIQKTEGEAGGSNKEKVPYPKPTADRPNVAVVSSNGIEVDLHLGQATRVIIYGPREDGLTCLLTSRNIAEPGKGSERWQELADIIADCFVILTASAGNAPRKILSEHGISVIITEENIEGCVDVLFGGGKQGKKKRG